MLQPGLVFDRGAQLQVALLQPSLLADCCSPVSSERTWQGLA